MNEFRFYYDESEHSQKITKATFDAENYYDSFVTVSVGWSLSNEALIAKRYESFETKFQKRMSGGELKSTTVKFGEFKHGFASLNKGNLTFLNDFFSLIDDNVHITFSVISKVEYAILQLFAGYKNSIFADMDSLRYSIVKSIILYRPTAVIDAMFNNPPELVESLRQFFLSKIEENQSNPTLKQLENSAYEQALLLLDDVSDGFNIRWEYRTAFDGLRKYTQEKGIVAFTLLIDKVGQDGTMLGFAKDAGIHNAIEVDSKDFFGIRFADMLAGTIAKMLKAIHRGLDYKNPSEQVSKKLLRPNWFMLNEAQFKLYKKFARVLLEINPAWYKSYAGNYADDLVSLNSLLNYIQSYDSLAKFNEITPEMHGEYFNGYVCKDLEKQFERMHSKLPVDIESNNKDYLINRQGAKVYYDISKNPMLELPDGETKLYILSVGFTNDGVPTATVKQQHDVMCYRLPADLAEWAITCVGFANLGENIFPSYVSFNTVGDKHYVDIL